MKVSICGKGGSGKSTVVALLANTIRDRGISVLIIDSDESNSGLFRMLGLERPPVPLMELVGGKVALRRKMGEPSVLEQEVITVEEIPKPYIHGRDGLNLVSIGKVLQSFEGCACPMGVLSREFLKKLRLMRDEIAIVDMEAGVEHFGRGIDEAIDKVILVVEPSFESLTVAEKVQSLATGMDKKARAVLNKVPSEMVTKKLERELRKKNIEVIGAIPYDPIIFDSCLEGLAIDRGKAFDAAEKICDAVLSEE
jgi:CO dehydrogenase maturation factor